MIQTNIGVIAPSIIDLYRLSCQQKTKNTRLTICSDDDQVIRLHHNHHYGLLKIHSNTHTHTQIDG